MAELFRHTDEDGDRLYVAEAGELGGRYVKAMIGDGKGWSSAVYLDRDAALRLAAALVQHFGPEVLTKEETDAQG